MRVPPLLEKYCLSICSGDFNQWTRKVAATDQPFSFMRTIEWEMPYWNLGQTFDYAEMAYLMVPAALHGRARPPRRWSAATTGWRTSTPRCAGCTPNSASRTAREIEFFQGGHSINGEGTFAFLHKHLNWPTPGERR